MADAYLFPTRSAEFVISIPLSVMEALSCGVPVIGYKSFENLNEITGSEGAITLVDNAEQGCSSLHRISPQVVQSLCHLVPAIRKGGVLSKGGTRGKNKCGSRAAAEIPSSKKTANRADRGAFVGSGPALFWSTIQNLLRLTLYLSNTKRSEWTIHKRALDRPPGE